jgi:hypothetical protein
MATKSEKNQAIKDWDKYRKDLLRATVVDVNETQEDKLKRMARLEADDEAWFKYYFPNYYSSEPAPFHKRSTKRIMNNPEFYEVLALSRELAKTARAMMATIKLVLTKKKRFVILTSASEAAAVKLLKPYKINFESNQRIINDYGVQQTFGDWTDNAFNTKIGATFVALGAGQSPRGLRNEEVRPDVILVDDFDTDEICRNPDRVQQNWDWLEQALFATRSISKPLLIVFCGNIIADDCCMKRAIARAKQLKKLSHYEIINIRDKKGKSTWPAKNTEEMIDRVLSMISWASAQKEYFNTPITLGKVFKKMHYGKMQPLKNYKFLVAYTDPSYKKNGDTKATALLGKYKDEYHVIKMFCAKTTVAKMLDWNYQIKAFVGDKTPVFYYIEYPWIDDALKIEIKAANKRHKTTLVPKADERKKPDKFYRIEANLEPLNRAGKLIFNEDLQGSEDMTETEGQFLALSPKSKAHDDAPDAVEGAKWVLDSKTKTDFTKIETKQYSRISTSKHF